MFGRLKISPINRRLLLLATRFAGSSYTETMERSEFPGKVRMGFIPEEWFQFFYKKTGVTGPYMFGFGLLTYLCSKEIYVMEHEYYSGFSLAIMSVLAAKRLGPMVANWVDKGVDQVEAEWKSRREQDLKQIQGTIEAEKLEQWRADGALILLDIKRQNIDLQVEAANREAAMEIYKDIMLRLNHQVACNYLYTRMNQKNMVQWIVLIAIKEVSEKKGNESIKKALADLTALAERTK